MDFFRQMDTFVRIVESQSISAAARTLRMSVAAVSRQLQAFERAVGAQLAVRTTRRMRLTEAGERWYERCRRVLSDIEDARATIGKGVQGVITVSAGIALGNHFVTPRLPALLRRHGGLTVDLRLDDQLVHLTADGIDVAIRGGSAPPDSNAVIAQKLATFQRWVVASPAYLRRAGTPRDPRELTGHACLVQANGGGRVRWSLTRGDATRLVDAHGPVRSSTPMVLRDMALAGLGCASLADWLVDADVKRGKLRRLFPDWSSPSVDVWAIYRTELRGSARVQALIQALRPEPAPRLHR